MIPYQDLRRLAEIHSPEGTAISFYFQADPPPDRSHRTSLIVVKDLVQEAVARADRENKPPSLKRALQKILEMADGLRAQHDRAKVVFACPEKDIWEEFDLPARLAGCELVVNNRFHFKPLGVLQKVIPNCVIGVVDRARARFWGLDQDQLTELPELMNEDLPRRGRGDGFAGFEGGHAERHFENEAMRHFKAFADRLHAEMERLEAEFVFIGCRDELYPDVERHLHTYVKQRLLGKFGVDPALASGGQLRAEVQPILDEHFTERQQSLVREVIGESQRNGNGALGLRAVLQALERGEVQTLVVGKQFSAPAVECSHCGHLDSRISKECAVCGNENREVEDVTDLLIARAVDHGAEMEYVDGVVDFADTAIGARLRFRADQNTAEKLAS